MSADSTKMPQSPLPLGNTEERELAEAFKRGEPGAYEIIHQQYSDRVERLCHRMLRNPSDAAEASQETFLKVYQSLNRFNGRYHLSAWITRIATNVCLDQLRVQSRRPAVPAAQEDLVNLPMRELRSESAEEKSLRRAEDSEVRKILKAMPELHRVAIVLRDFQGLSYAEIADVLAMSEAQVKALIHRARQGFKRSWLTAAASMLIPGRLLERLRGSYYTHKEQVAQLIAPSSPAAVHCTTVLQQCGQVLGERVGNIALAAGVSVAAVGGFSPAPHLPAQLPATVAAAEASLEKISKRSPSRPESTEAQEGPAPQVPDTVESEPLPTAPDPLPTAGPSPVPSPVASQGPPPQDQGGGGGGQRVEEQEPSAGPSPDPTPPPEPTAFSGAFVLDVPSDGSYCRECEAMQVVTEGGRGDESGLIRFEQSLRGSSTYEGKAVYGLELTHRSVSGGDHEASFTLKTPEGGYRYSAQGRRVTAERTEWGGWRYTYSGTYKLQGRPAMHEPVPVSGSYTVTLDYSYTQQRLWRSSFSLTEH